MLCCDSLVTERLGANRVPITFSRMTWTSIRAFLELTQDLTHGEEGLFFVERSIITIRLV